jgi:hypothetical protein
MPTRDHNPVPRQKEPRKPTQTSPDDDEAQGADLTHAADMSEAQQARRRREQDLVTQVEDEEAEDDEDEADGIGPRPG